LEKLFKHIEYKPWGQEVVQTYGSRSSLRNEQQILRFEAILLYHGEDVWKTLAKNLNMLSEELKLVQEIHSNLSKFDIDVILLNKEAQFKYQHFNRPGKLLSIVLENAVSGIKNHRLLATRVMGFIVLPIFFKRNS
jgi:hypothetical protein